VLAAASAAAAAGGPLRLRALNWLAAEADAGRALSTAPTECLRTPDDPAAARAVEVGRAAFRNPLLLGGQAGRAGLSCESCHRGGRGNPDFHFPGVSGAPGTADVTSSLFSTHRGDGVDDPRPIPDLSAPKSALKVSQAPADRALEPFIRGLVVEEFDGHEPPAAVLAGLAAYVRALDPAACPTSRERPQSLDALMDDARRAVAAAEGLAGAGDRTGAALLVGGARSALGQIDERYAGEDLASERARLRHADGELAALAEALRQGEPDAVARLARWRAQSQVMQAVLARHQDRSLFNRGRLEAALKRRLPGQAS
jgi:hypothetical protein